MTHRSDRYVLPITEERCSANANPCSYRTTCARYLAPITPGAPLADHTHTGRILLCMHYLSAEDSRRKHAAGDTRTVHPTPKGLQQ